MATKIVDTILPTTMVGSYPRPHWFKHQLLGRDIRVAFKEVQHEEAYDDAVATVIRDQEEAGLDIVTDGNMWYDDYVGVIGSFCWYMYERIGGVRAGRAAHPPRVGAGPANLAWHVYFQHYKNAKDLSFALAHIFNKEMKDLVAAGAKYLQFEDLGPWLGLFTNDPNDFKWVRE